MAIDGGPAPDFLPQRRAHTAERARLGRNGASGWVVGGELQQGTFSSGAFEEAGEKGLKIYARSFEDFGEVPVRRLYDSGSK